MKVVSLVILLVLLAIPGLLGAARLSWSRRTRNVLPRWRNIVGAAGILLVLGVWSLFVLGSFRGWVGGFGSHYLTQPAIANRMPAREFSLYSMYFSLETGQSRVRNWCQCAGISAVGWKRNGCLGGAIALGHVCSR